MKPLAKCRNYSGCLISYRGEDIVIEDEGNLLCPECGKPVHLLNLNERTTKSSSPLLPIVAVVAIGAGAYWGVRNFGKSSLESSAPSSPTAASTQATAPLPLVRPAAPAPTSPAPSSPAPLTSATPTPTTSIPTAPIPPPSTPTLSAPPAPTPPSPLPTALTLPVDAPITPAGTSTPPATAPAPTPAADNRLATLANNPPVAVPAPSASNTRPMTPPPAALEIIDNRAPATPPAPAPAIQPAAPVAPSAPVTAAVEPPKAPQPAPKPEQPVKPAPEPTTKPAATQDAATQALRSSVEPQLADTEALSPAEREKITTSLGKAGKAVKITTVTFLAASNKVGEKGKEKFKAAADAPDVAKLKEAGAVFVVLGFGDSGVDRKTRIAGAQERAAFSSTFLREKSGLQGSVYPVAMTNSEESGKARTVELWAIVP